MDTEPKNTEQWMQIQTHKWEGPTVKLHADF